MPSRILQRGYILIPVSIAIAIIGILAYFSANQSAMNVNSANREIESAQANYVAQAGLQHGLRRAAQQGCGPYTDLTNITFGNDQYSSTLTTDLGVTTPYTINVDQDAWIRSDTPTANTATDWNLQISYAGGASRRPVFRYDVSPIPAGSTILSAQAWFYVTSEYPEGAVDIHRLEADWNETDATWNSLGTEMDGTVQTSLEPQPDRNLWVSANLTSQVQAWVNGQPNFGITLDATSEGVGGSYASRETANPPYLEVIVGTPPTPSATILSVATLAQGTIRSITRNNVSLYQHTPMYKSIQPGPDNMEDAWITATKTDWGYGGHNEISANEAGGPQRGLIRFDLDNVLPPGAKLVNATLELYSTSMTGSGQISLYGLQQDWVEGSCAVSCTDAVTWDTTDGVNNWVVSGTTADTDATAQTPAASSNSWYSWDITSITSNWISGQRPNYGLLIKGEAADASFNSSDNTDTGTHPKISLTYSCECGTACVSPQGSGKIGMVVKYNGLQLFEEDQRKKDLLESWGYEVDAFSDVLLFLFHPTEGNHDVVYISSTADANSIGTRFTGTSMGVVNELGEQNDELEIATATSSTTGSSITITDNSHQITHIFPSGELSIYNADMQIQTLSGTQASGLQTLANNAGTDSLVVLEQGMLTTSGSPAAGRRVNLPLGNTSDTQFDWLHMNNNGHLLINNAIEWAKVEFSCNDGDYRDEFESVAFNNSDGSLDWSNDWVEVDSDENGASAGNVEITGNELRLHFQQDDTPYSSMTRSFNLKGANNAILTFDFNLGSGTDQGNDEAVLEITTDGNTWTELEDFSQWGGDHEGNAEFALSSHLGADTQIRFRIVNGYTGNNEYLAIDNLAINVCGTLIKPKKIYWTDDVADVIQRSDEDGSNVETVLAGLDQPRGLDIDTVNGKIYWSSDDLIKRADLDGSNIETIYNALLFTIFDVKLDVAAGKMYWTYDNSLNLIKRADLDGGNDETINSSLDAPTYFSVDTTAGHLYLSDFGNGNVERMNLDGSATTTIISGSGTAIGNAIDTVNGRLYWTGGASNDWIKRADLDGSNEETLVTGLNAPQDIAHDADNDRIYWTDALNQVVQRADADGSNVETIVTGLNRPRAIVVVDADRVPPTGGGGGGPDPDPFSSCNGTYRDDFDSLSFGGSNGSIDWSATHWSEVGESDGAGSGDVQIMEDSAVALGHQYKLRIRDNNNGGEGVERLLNLNGASSATLSFEYRREGLDNSNDYVAVYASSTGTAGPWTELPTPRIEGGGTDGSYQTYTRDISDYISSNTAIRLRSSPNMGNSDTVYFDNLEISCSP